MKKYIIQLMQWMIAGVVAVVICNGLLMTYHRPTGWIDRSNSATNAIWRPNSTILMGTEGRGYHTVDDNGYINLNLPKQEHYCLVVGSSYTQGKEVLFGYRYTDLLNDMLAENTETLAVYNCSQDGYFLPDIISNFCAITEEFSDADTIVIETITTDFSSEALKEACNQHEFDEKQVGSVILSNLSMKQKAKMLMKEGLPIYSILKSQLIAIQNKGGDVGANSMVDTEQEECLLEALALIRSQFDGQLVILYHPKVTLSKEGNLVITQQETTSMFAAACEVNNIVFVDVSDAFLDAYESDYSVPYGFSNTIMASGHLNVDGHRVIAEELYRILKEDK